LIFQYRGLRFLDHPVYERLLEFSAKMCWTQSSWRPCRTVCPTIRATTTTLCQPALCWDYRTLTTWTRHTLPMDASARLWAHRLCLVSHRWAAMQPNMPWQLGMWKSTATACDFEI